MTFKYKGIYRIFRCLLYRDFHGSDVEFESVLTRAVEGAPRARFPAEVRIGIADTGVYVTPGKDDDFFRPRWIAGRDFGTRAAGVPTNGQPDTMGKHGSCVASIATWGTDRLKILDIQLGKNQEGGEAFNAERFAAGLEWAIREGAKIINCSKLADWGAPVVSTVVAQNPGVLFIDTAGNNNTLFGQDYLRHCQRAYNAGNIILVTGCKNDLTQADDRGHGPAVHVTLPSYQVPCLAPLPVRRAHYQAAVLGRYEQNEARARAELEASQAAAQQKIEELTEELKSKTGMVRSLCEQRINQQRNLLNRQYRPGARPQPPIAEDVTSDDGTSFACPMVANIAAKMLIINQWLTPKKIIEILMRTSDKKNALNEVCRARGVINPARAYVHALLERPSSQTDMGDVLNTLIRSIPHYPMLTHIRNLEPELDEVDDREWT